MSTPEAAIMAYLDGVKQRDVPALLAGSAIETTPEAFAGLIGGD